MSDIEASTDRSGDDDVHHFNSGKRITGMTDD